MICHYPVVDFALGVCIRRDAVLTRHAVLISAGNIEDSLPASLSAFHGFLTSPAGGSWREEDITVTGPLSWPVVQLLQAREIPPPRFYRPLFVPFLKKRILRSIKFQTSSAYQKNPAPY